MNHTDQLMVVPEAKRLWGYRNWLSLVHDEMAVRLGRNWRSVIKTLAPEEVKRITDHVIKDVLCI